MSGNVTVLVFVAEITLSCALTCEEERRREFIVTGGFTKSGKCGGRTTLSVLNPLLYEELCCSP